MKNMLCFPLDISIHPHYVTVHPDYVIIEDLSATTAENAAFVRIILKRTPTFDWVENVKLITNLYHIPTVVKAFEEAGVKAEPLPAEDLLWGTEHEGRVLEYYRDRQERTGNPFPNLERLAEIAQKRGSVLELLV